MFGLWTMDATRRNSVPDERENESASGQGLRTAQNTQEMMAVAGLAPDDRRRKNVRLVLSLLVLLAVLGTGGILALTQLAGSMPENPAGDAQTGREDKGVETDAQSNSSDSRRIRSLFEGRATKRRSAKNQRSYSPGQRELMAFYRNDIKEEYLPAVPRATLNGTQAEDVELALGAAAGLRSGSKDEVVPTLRGPAGGQACPVADGVRQVFRENRKRIDQRLDRLLTEHPALSGKLILVISLLPEGKLRRVRLEPQSFRGTAVEDYLVQEVKRWRFPAFEGPPCEVSIPMLLTAR